MDTLQQLLQQGLLLILLISLPPIIASLMVGLIVGLLQATTQLQDFTLTFVPRLIAVFAVLLLAGPWIGRQILRFTQVLLSSFALIQ